MLISMPTGTSTIFGVFQVIGSSQQVWRDAHAGAEPRGLPDVAQVRTRHVEYALRCDISLLDKAASLPVKAPRYKCRIAIDLEKRAQKPVCLDHNILCSRLWAHRQSRGQQSLSAIFASGLTPCASCAAVGCPCICL
jgi:hypothetical protein